MNLKIKTTIIFLKLMITAAMLTVLIFLICWLLLAYPIIIGVLTIGLLIVFVTVGTWLSIYYKLKEEEK